MQNIRSRSDGARPRRVPLPVSSSRTFPHAAARLPLLRSYHWAPTSSPRCSPTAAVASRTADSDMGNTASGATEASNPTEKTEQTPPPETKSKKKICCACPDTKKLRDECVVQHGEDACGKWIEAHRQCLRAEGFNV
ncbi:hypothetical protein GUJ93_ZPchr0009g1765 [Zizania palustris]|uniref:Cytochrome c oxidase copper chaperone n=1 Tax=Zizania palustris TaxID=103762 RepID=A0A8J5VK90_ZIZPA|nr:hypothetical protein GUJ93_ZPchr0009g1765 [Zizania palustris]